MEHAKKEMFRKAVGNTGLEFTEDSRLRQGWTSAKGIFKRQAEEQQKPQR